MYKISIAFKRILFPLKGSEGNNVGEGWARTYSGSFPFLPSQPYKHGSFRSFLTFIPTSAPDISTSYIVLRHIQMDYVLFQTLTVYKFHLFTYGYGTSS